jgi:hypothetical protein
MDGLLANVADQAVIHSARRPGEISKYVLIVMTTCVQHGLDHRDFPPFEPISPAAFRHQ